MTEQEARDWLRLDMGVSRETMGAVERFVEMLCRENERQNLVSRESLKIVWARHIVDSAQLLAHAPAPGARWVDLGSGPGLPGLVIALLRSGRVTLVEERRQRVDFLERAVEELGLVDRVEILGARVETLAPRRFDVISARAFAPLDRLLALGERFAASETRWVLPKGKNSEVELDAARRSWQGDFRLEPSLTASDAKIVVAERVRRRGKGTGQ